MVNIVIMLSDTHGMGNSLPVSLWDTTRIVLPGVTSPHLREVRRSNSIYGKDTHM